MPRPSSSGRKKAFSCSICPKKFTTKHSRKTHVLVIHENVGRYRCGQCDRACRSRTDLGRHEGVCKRRFIQKSNLELHHLDAHSERKFECPTCGQAFGRQADLRQHLAVHSNERSFECEQCGASFKRLKYLKNHLATHSSQEQLGVKVKRSDGNQASGSGQYELRARGKIPNYRVDQEDEGGESSSTEDDESGSESQGSDESDESDENGSNEEAVARESGFHEKEQQKSGQFGFKEPEESSERLSRKPESSTVTGPKLKVVFDVEYRAPC